MLADAGPNEVCSRNAEVAGPGGPHLSDLSLTLSACEVGPQGGSPVSQLLGLKAKAAAGCCPVEVRIWHVLRSLTLCKYIKKLSSEASPLQNVAHTALQCADAAGRQGIALLFFEFL